MRTGKLSLLIVVAAVAALAAFLLSRDQAARRADAAGEPVFAGLIDRVNDVAALVVTGPNGSATVSRDGAGWSVDALGGYAADAGTVGKVVLGVARLTLKEQITSRAESHARLGVHEPLADRFELEIGAYRDGDFFAPHWDRGDGATRVRRITTLFYFHAQPPQFSGGQLQLFDTGANGEFDRAGWTGFPPTGNTMLQFRSEAIHAVTPVHGPARFADSRFCLTFWAHQRH